MEELKTQIRGLQAEIQALDSNREVLESRLTLAEESYRESTLPEITEDFSILIENSIRAAVNNIDFSDEENYDISHEINYKELSTQLNFLNREELISLVLINVTELFKVIEA